MPFLSKNLAALQSWNPTAARLIEAAIIPEIWQPLRARDESPTFANRSNPSTIEWLGATSMPHESAAALVFNLSPGETNGLALGLGTGHEWRAFACRLSPAQMLFILETDPAAARMVLTICDLSPYLAAGRLVLLLEPPTPSSAATPAPNATNQLLDFLRRHPGFDPPAVLHPLPTLTGPRRNALLALGEHMVRQSVTERTRVALETASAVHALPVGTEKSALALLLTPRHAFERTTTALAAALQSAGWPIHQIFIDHFTSSSTLTRWRALLQTRPTLLLSDLFRSQCGIPLPTDLRVLTVIPPRPLPAFWQPDRLPSAATLAPRDLILCHAEAHRRLLLEAGYPSHQIQMLEPGITAANIEKITATATPAKSSIPARPLALRHRVALIADIPSINPEHYGFNLPTHADIWHAACTVLAEDAWRAQPDMVDDILRRAQRRAGITLEDPELLNMLRRGTRHILLASVPLLTVAQQLAEAKIDLKLIGDGWQNPGASGPPACLTAPAVTVAGWPTAPNDDALWNDVALVLHFSPDASVHPLELAAPQHGAALVALQHPWDGRPGTLQSLLQANEQYTETTTSQTIATLRGLLRDAPKRTRLAQAAATALQEKSESKSLQTILETRN